MTARSVSPRREIATEEIDGNRPELACLFQGFRNGIDDVDPAAPRRRAEYAASNPTDPAPKMATVSPDVNNGGRLDSRS